MNPSISSVREVEVECSDQALWEGHSSLLIHYYDAASLLRCSIPGDLFLFSLLEFISSRNPWVYSSPSPPLSCVRYTHHVVSLLAAYSRRIGNVAVREKRPGSGRKRSIVMTQTNSKI